MMPSQPLWLPSCIKGLRSRLERLGQGVTHSRCSINLRSDSQEGGGGRREGEREEDPPFKDPGHSVAITSKPVLFWFPFLLPLF